MVNETQQISTYRKNQDKYLTRCLIGLLAWLTSKIKDNEEQIVIVLTKDNPPTFYRTASFIRYVPPQTTTEKVTLKTSDWRILQHIKSVKLDDVKALLEKCVPGIDITAGTVGNSEALLIDWKQINVTFIEDDREKTLEKRIPIPYRVLTFLSRNPSCIVKGKNSFSDRLGMEFEESNKIVFVGDGATYIFNRNGFNYIGLDNLKKFKKSECKDRVDIIEHREKDLTRASYKRKVNKYMCK